MRAFYIVFNFIQQSPLLLQMGDVCNKTSNSVGFKSLLNKVKASGGCLRFFRGNFSSKLEKNLGANTPRRI
jgi:hypothetical protein